ncbi:MAG: protein-export chaperone SecB [Hyphomicrobium sp. SCN 65-11]|nr:MAG: protein-export chaperone SecB [Hyphomicrobium sp. SCN 65-11]
MPKNPTPTSGNGPAASAGAAQPQQVQVRIAGQYIKDLSFENPNIGKLITSAPESPNLDVEINVSIAELGANLYESAIDFKARAKAKDLVIYEFEVVYGGAFQIENAPPQALEPMLFVNCPSLLFPFLRRIVADITREGGFPPLLLDPVDFGALYMRKKQLGMPPQAGPSTALS